MVVLGLHIVEVEVAEPLVFMVMAILEATGLLTELVVLEVLVGQEMLDTVAQELAMVRVEVAAMNMVEVLGQEVVVQVVHINNTV
jgi:hypothetical protein